MFPFQVAVPDFEEVKAGPSVTSQSQSKTKRMSTCVVACLLACARLDFPTPKHRIQCLGATHRQLDLLHDLTGPTSTNIPPGHHNADSVERPETLFPSNTRFRLSQFDKPYFYYKV